MGKIKKSFIKIIIFFAAVFLLIASLIILDFLDVVNLPFIGRTEEWSIGIYEGQNGPFRFLPPVSVSNPVLTRHDVSDVDADYVADPFMIERQGVWYMFFEVMNSRTRQGDIGLALSSDGFQWKYQKIVLDEPFHLSYPYVFESEGREYILIGAHANGGIRLYEAVSFPDNWRYVGDVLRGEYLDCSLVRQGGVWWLFAGGFDHASLHVFFSSRLTGPYQEHPQSPVVTNTKKYSRPGGRVLSLGTSLVRFAQDDESFYGSGVWAFEVSDLTPQVYREVRREHPALEKGRTGWNACGMHTLDPHLVRGKWLACVDGVRLRIFVRLSAN